MQNQSLQITREYAAARAAMAAGNYRQAHQHCLAVLNMDRHHADAWFLCGIIAGHNKQFDKAGEILNNAISLNPENPRYHAELGKNLLARRLPDKALEAAEYALTLQPQQPAVLDLLGTVFSHCGDHVQSLDCFDKAWSQLKREPGSRDKRWLADFHFNYAAALKIAGQFPAAEQHYESALTLDPNLFRAHSAIASLRKQTRESNHLPRLQALRDSVKTADDQLHLGHAIAKELEDIGEYVESLESLDWAKHSAARDVAYSATADAEFFCALREVFTRQWFEEHGISLEGHANSEPIFIVGMPRTGTTLTEQVLSSHSAVSAQGELQNFPLQLRSLAATGATNLPGTTELARMADLNMAELGKAYIDSTRPGTGNSQHFTDKLPLNFLYLGLIGAALPSARLVCLRRDPMDTCLSNYRQMFAVNFRPYHYNLDLMDCGRYYIEFDRMMRHWHSVMPGRIYDLQYEDLVSTPETTVHSLLQYCQLPWEEDCLTFHQRQPNVATPSTVQVRQGIYTSSVGRWERYGDAMTQLHKLLCSAGLYS